MEGKKISFGFLKTKKTEKPVVEEKKEFIECMEEQAIKVVGGEPINEIQPLVIPMKPNTLITAERLKEIAEKVEQGIEEPEPTIEPVSVEETTQENETLDQMAVRELLQESKKDVQVEVPALTVPIPNNAVMLGEKESTLDDYDAVPIQEFGMAMLRGMGWKPNKDQVKYKQPQLRPKGLGLGADKVLSKNQKKGAKDKEEELAIVKNSFVKITTGKHCGCYGKVVSLDEDNGRVMVDIPIKKETVSLSEFMMQPVTKSEFDKESKVINMDSYEEYKRNERNPKVREASTSQRSNVPSSDQREIKHDKERKDNKEDYRSRDKEDRDDYRRRERDLEKSSNGRSTDKSRSRRNSSSSEDRSRTRKKEKKRDKSSESLDSISDSDRRKKKDKKKNKEKKRYSSNESIDSVSNSDRYRKHKKKKDKRYSESDDSDYKNRDRKDKSPTPEGKRDIDKKRKGKKKKRDRDRSPNYKKHRK